MTANCFIPGGYPGCCDYHIAIGGNDQAPRWEEVEIGYSDGTSLTLLIPNPTQEEIDQHRETILGMSRDLLSIMDEGDFDDRPDS